MLCVNLESAEALCLRKDLAGFVTSIVYINM